MGYNILSGTISAIEGFFGSGSFTGSFGGDGADLVNVKQFDMFGSQASGRVVLFKQVSGETHIEGDNNLFFDTSTDTLTTTRLSASSGINLSGLAAGQTVTSSFLALDSNNNIILTSSSGKISELNNRVADRLVTIGSTTTELDGEANLTFNGNFLTLQGGLVLNRRQISSSITASNTDYYLGISASSNIDIRLPAAQSLSNGQTFVFKDENGTAGTYIIKINASSSQTIDNHASVILESPFAAINIYSNGNSKYFIF